MKNMRLIHFATFGLVLVGAINWGMVAFFDFNIVSVVFGAGTTLERIVYALVGLSGLYLLATHKSDCKICSKMK